MDEAVIDFISREHKLVIGTYEAENIKIRIGSAAPLKEKMTFTARGKDLVTGVPKAVVVTDDEIREALKGPVKAIVDVVERALGRTSPALAADIYESGVMITGGGSLLRGLDRRIAAETNLKVYRAKDPLRSVVMGSGKVLDQFKLLKKICVT